MATLSGTEFFDKIEKDFLNLTREAAKYAAKRAQRDIRKKANSFIDQYYAWQPAVYTDRKYALYRMISDYMKVVSNNEIEFGIEYKPHNIAGVHKSGSWYHQSGTKWIPRSSGNFDYDSQNNGIPEASWIAEQYLEGIHPWAHTEPKGADELMQEFFDTELPGLVDKYMSKALMDAIRRYF